MFDSLEKMGQEVAAPSVIPPKLRDRLQNSKVNAQREIERVNEVLELLDRNPDVERIIQLLGRGNY